MRCRVNPTGCHPQDWRLAFVFIGLAAGVAVYRQSPVLKA